MPKNIKVKPIPIELDKTRHLLLDLNAFVELEEIYGSIDKAFEGIEGKSVKAVRAFLWAGLIHEDESLSIKDVGRMVTIQNLQTLAAQIADAIESALPDADAAGEEKNSQNPA